MHRYLWPLAVALLLPACGSTPERPAPTPAGPAANPAAAATPTTTTTAAAATAAPAAEPAPKPVVTALAAGNHFSCAIRAADGRVVCWGMLPLEEEKYHPPRVMGPAGRATQVMAGTEHVCIIDEAHQVYCWGHGSSGQLGRLDLNRKSSKTPVHVSKIKHAKRLAGRANNNCVLLEDNSLVCWGYYVELPKAGGLRTYMVLEPDELFHGIESAQEVGTGQAGCFRAADGRLACWSWLREGESRAAQLVPGVRDAVDVDIGGNVCVARRDGRVSCWGDNNMDGALGTKGIKEAKEPLDVPGIQDAVGVCVGSGFACSQHRDGGISCWGRSTSGQIGRVTEEGQPPTRVPGVANATDLVCGQHHACVIRKDGQVLCWGSSMGPGKPGSSSPPRVIDGIADAK